MKRFDSKILLLGSLLLVLASRNASSSEGVPVPTVLRFSGSVHDPSGNMRSGRMVATFALYRDEIGGALLWSEARTVTLDGQGRFAVLLGLVTSGGIPAGIFEAGEPRWVGIMLEDGTETPRVLLTTVPYAFKAADADTLGGKGVENFVSQEQLRSLLTNHPSAALSSEPRIPTSGSLSFSPSPSSITPSVEQGISFESTSPTGPSFISDATAGPPLQVASRTFVANLNGEFLSGFAHLDFAKVARPNLFSQNQAFQGGVTLAPLGGSSATSSPLDFQTLSLSPLGGNSIRKVFRWQAATASGDVPSQLQLWSGKQPGFVTPTGFLINSDGTLQFAANQQFPSSAILAAIGETAQGGQGSQPVVYTAPYQWTQTPSPQSGPPQGIQGGPNSINLSPCPIGVNGNDAWHYLYISGTGTPEEVLITGGSCKSGARSGTIEFQAAGPHPPGYSVGTATAGIQEALTDAVVSAGQSPAFSRPVVINPGNALLRARLSIRANNLTISGLGATLTCAMNDTCVMLGDPSSGVQFTRITLSGVTFQPGFVNGTNAAIEDNANGSSMSQIGATYSGGGASFGYLIQVDNDQAAHMDNINSNGQGFLRCDASFCGSTIYAPGPFAINAAVGWISQSNISLPCRGNGIDWQSGNTLSVTNSIVQGYSQYGVRGGIAAGGYGNVQLSNVYEEAGHCKNPTGNIGQAGIIISGGQAYWTGGMGPQGNIPQFANTGPNRWSYYIMPWSASYGFGNPLYAGNAFTDNITPVTVTTPDIPGATSFDLLKIAAPTVEGELQQAPNGLMTAPTGGAVAVGVLRTSVCSNGLCTFTDATNAAPGSYTVSNPPKYFPKLKYWPGGIVLSAQSDGNSVLSGASLHMDVDYSAGGGPGSVNSVTGDLGPSVYSTQCPDFSTSSSVWVSCISDALFPQVNFQQESFLLPNEPAGTWGVPASTNLKGRLNFLTSSSLGHIITLIDSNGSKTIATERNRPHNDPLDSYIGTDQTDTSNLGLSFGSSEAISSYIANIGDGKSYGERLTASSKIFNVPVTVNGSLTVRGTCTGCGTSQSALVVDVAHAAFAPPTPGQSSLGFDKRGVLSVFEDGGPVKEVEKKAPQEFTYTFFDPHNTLLA